jgi:hypothetical protein
MFLLLGEISNRQLLSVIHLYQEVSLYSSHSFSVSYNYGQSGAGAGFLRVLRFPLPIFIPPIAPKIFLIYHLGFVQ